MNRIIITTGYMGSGSSAMTDLLSEIDGYCAPNNDFEYVFLHCPNGFFDLEAKLTMLNNSNRSDEAIRTFLDEMNMLYKLSNKKYWIAGYKSLISDSFLQYVYDFLRDIGVKTIKGTWYFQEYPTLTYNIKKIVWKVNKKLKIIKNTYPSNENIMLLAFPTRNKFYQATKTFLNKIYIDLGIEDNNLILDQLILPHNAYKVENYFDDNTFVYIIDRDPRDVFVLNKYYWKYNPVPYPTDVKSFCDIYEKIRKSEIRTEEHNIKRIHFEDLIYDYDNILQTIYVDLNINDKLHNRKFEKFNPKISINNTQVFLQNNIDRDEIKYIEDTLPEYLYPFPYKIEENNNCIF